METVTKKDYSPSELARIEEMAQDVVVNARGNGVIHLRINLPGPGAKYHGAVYTSGEARGLMVNEGQEVFDVVGRVLERAQEIVTEGASA